MAYRARERKEAGIEDFTKDEVRLRFFHSSPRPFYPRRSSLTGIFIADGVVHEQREPGQP